MADSDNTTTLPSVTRRRLLAKTTAAECQPRAFARNDLETDQSADPAVAVWRKGQAATTRLASHAASNSVLSRNSPKQLGFRVRPAAVPWCIPFRRFTKSSIVIHRTGQPARRLTLASHQGLWNAADREVGYSATLRTEREAAVRAVLLEILSDPPLLLKPVWQPSLMCA
ncbi:hypothetical protein EOA30_25235 [Mesorhizobium sp. M8A.F.Ca.ET.059.01.1.1]|nr:hypothetical protein EOA30_25235 [Mesorhizobium sp. M8A.F.Ca.ET.059.01.1.1]